MKSLVLAEKPSVAKEIARVLQCRQRGKGYLEGSQYVVTWALGHLVTLAEPHDYDQRLKEWRIEDLPMLPERMKLKVIKQTSHQYQVIKALMNRSDIKDLVIATDAGREGELVARWIMAKAQWKKPFSRLWVSSQTDAAIREGFARLQPGHSYNNLYEAAVCRAEADWLIGLNVTRTLTCKFNAQLSAGRVQTPTLAMIVDREKEIKQFKPVDYWTVRADFGGYFGDWRSISGSRIYEHAKAQAIVAKVSGKSGVIKEVKTEAKQEQPPLAYDLTELQRDANRRYAWSAQKTSSILQDLYERHKLVTYPRTDSRYISSDIVPTLKARLEGMKQGPYNLLVESLLQKPLKPGKRLVNDAKVTDHHAIIPTEQTLNLRNLDDEERRLYDLIARRFLAVLHPPYRFNQTTIVTMVDGENFYSSGRVEVERGWKTVQSSLSDKEAQDTEDLPEQTLAQHKKGEILAVKGCKINKKQTKPPSRYTEATLLTSMENCGKLVADEELRESIQGSGLGTPATRAEIIEKLVNTSYIERHGKELLPTSKGIQLVNLAPETLRSPELTARWEQKLTDIAAGKAKRSVFISDIRNDTVRLVDTVKKSTSSYRADNVSKTKCPLCGKFMLLVNSKRGRILSCPDRACGHRQPEKESPYGHSGTTSRATQKLIAKYSDKEDLGTNLGELLKAALAEKEKGKS